MNKKDFNNKSWELCAQALSNLRTKKLPPLPNNYQVEFNELLEHQMSDEFTRETYKQELISININKYLEITQMALKAFIQSNQDISQVMQEHIQRITPTHGYTDDYLSKNCSKIVENLAQLDTEMSSALLRAHDQIKSLTQSIEVLTEENRIDPLTKFYNRKELFIDLTSLTGSLQNNETTSDCYLLMIDLDDFKAINDTNSHIAGDKTLVYVARTIKSMIRSTDRAYRFGGDEFILVLNRTTLDVAQSIAEKIRSDIEKARLFYENNEIRITVSIGVSKLSGKEVETSLLRADKALYEAKNKNKNQVFTIPSEEG